MTSNLGAEYLVAQADGEDSDTVRDQVMAEVRAHFRPEFLNRIDEIILFHRLKREQMGHIVEIQLASLQKLLEDRKIALTLDAKARDWLAEKGYDPAYGARPLKRVIQKSVQDPLAELILSGKIKDGEKVAVSAGKDGLVFNGAKVAAAARLTRPSPLWGGLRWGRRSGDLLRRRRRSAVHVPAASRAPPDCAPHKGDGRMISAASALAARARRR